MTLEQALQQTGCADTTTTSDGVTYHVKQTARRVYLTWEKGELLQREFVVQSLEDVHSYFKAASASQNWQPAQEFIN